MQNTNPLGTQCPAAWSPKEWPKAGTRKHSEVTSPTLGGAIPFQSISQISEILQLMPQIRKLLLKNTADERMEYLNAKATWL